MCVGGVLLGNPGSELPLLRGTIVNKTYDGIHKTNIVDHFYQLYLVLLTTVPRNSLQREAKGENNKWDGGKTLLNMFGSGVDFLMRRAPEALLGITLASTACEIILFALPLSASAEGTSCGEKILAIGAAAARDTAATPLPRLPPRRWR